MRWTPPQMEWRKMGSRFGGRAMEHFAADQLCGNQKRNVARRHCRAIGFFHFVSRHRLPRRCTSTAFSGFQADWILSLLEDTRGKSMGWHRWQRSGRAASKQHPDSCTAGSLARARGAFRFSIAQRRSVDRHRRRGTVSLCQRRRGKISATPMASAIPTSGPSRKIRREIFSSAPGVGFVFSRR